MTDEQRKALVQDYRAYAKMKPFPGPYITAADQIEADGKRIEALSAENERLIKAGDGDVGLIHWQGERIEKLEAALREIARLRTDLSGDFSLGSKQSDIARAALGDTK